MSTQIFFDGIAAARAERLANGSAAVFLTDDQGTVLTVTGIDRDGAAALVTAARDAARMLGADDDEEPVPPAHIPEAFRAPWEHGDCITCGGHVSPAGVFTAAGALA